MIYVVLLAQDRGWKNGSKKLGFKKKTLKSLKSIAKFRFSSS